jgi:hypothetical protein
MKAISIRQPWAWLIVNGFKNIENRDWPTKYRGNILIHASAGLTPKEYDDAVAFVKTFDWNIAAQIPNFEDLERGGIVGIAEIRDCVTASRSPWFVGKFGFVLRKPYPYPFRPMRGMLGLFRVNDLGLPED